jgi:polyisoprenoid-binding protein YceI
MKMAWKIDKSRTKLEFSVRHMMIQTVRGTFRDYDVDLDIDADHLEKSAVKARISTRSVATRDSLRDQYLVSKHFFNPDEFPHMVYESTSARISGTKLSLSGRLKIRDKEAQLLLNGSIKRPPSGPGPRHLSFELNGEVDREAYNLVFNGAVETVSIVVGKKVSLQLTIDLIEN